jgi:preprotein translocase subunit SecF
MTIKNHSKVCLMVSAAIMVVALVLSVFGMGINLGIDFAGGLAMQYNMGGIFNESDVSAVLKDMGVGEFTVTTQGAGKDEATIRIKSVGQDDIQAVQAEFEEGMKVTYPNLTLAGDVSYVGPVAGATLLSNAFWSVVIASALMLIYIAFRFDFNSGVAAVFGLIHDVLMMLAFMVLLRSVIQMNSSFIAAMLTIVGYSINNTIVIFDRIRENRKKLSRTDFDHVVNVSIHQTFLRSLNTTVTTFLTIATLFVLGVSSIRQFALPLMVGILAGMFSSVFLAGNLWAILNRFIRIGRKKEAPQEVSTED